MKDLAVAISVYDKFTDVKVLVDIFRRNFKVNVYIVVCSSHPEAAQHLADCDIDDLEGIEPIPFDPPSFNSAEVRLHLTLRVIDSIRKACGRAARSDASYTLHVHADGYPLSWERLQALIWSMTERGKAFAARGQGLGFYVHDCPVGALDDMFFVFDNAFARSAGLWDYELFDYLPHKVSMHGMLALLVLGKVGLRRFWLYTREEDAVHWDGRPVDLPPLNSSSPMYFDPQYAFLHLNVKAFPGNLGPRLKAWYLKRHGLSQGPALEDFLHRWETDERVLFDELRDTEERLRCFFRRHGLLGYMEATYGRNLGRLSEMMETYRRLSPPARLAWLLRRHGARAKSEVMRHYRERLVWPELYLHAYRDIVWPQQLGQVYRRTLRADPHALPELFDISFDSEFPGRNGVESAPFSTIGPRP